MPKIISGGGITSNKYVTSKAGQKVEPIAKKASPAGAAQLGMGAEFKKEPLISGKGFEPGPMPPTGVRGTFNAASQGPGSGRHVYGSGSQGTYGPVAHGEQNKVVDVPATAPGRDQLRDYGPDVPGKEKR